MLTSPDIPVYNKHMTTNEYTKQVVSWACGTISKNGWTLLWDNTSKMWDVETPSGWRTATNGAELCAIIRENTK